MPERPKTEALESLGFLSFITFKLRSLMSYLLTSPTVARNTPLSCVGNINLHARTPWGAVTKVTCATCGTPIMLDDKEGRIRAIVPNLMGYDPDSLPATYHAFYDSASGVPEPNDGRPVYEGLRPDFVWPESA